MSGKLNTAVTVRTRSVIYSYEPADPDGLKALRRELSRRGQARPSDVLGPISALQELDAICQGMIAGRGGPNQANRPSLVDDLQQALGQLGAETRTQARQALASFQSELTKLGSRLDTPQGARVVALQLKVLLDALRDEAVVAAAWRDAVATFVNDDSSAESCELRVAQLSELAEHRGVDYEAWVRAAECILGDDPRVLEALGEAVTSEDDSRGAGVARTRRLELCEIELSRLPDRSAFAVWLVIDNAALENTFLARGPVWFFDGSYWPNDFNDTTAIGKRIDSGLLPPPEFGDWDFVADSFANLAKAEHRVFVRVSLHDTTSANARRQAHRVVQEMIDLANSESAWTLLGGAASWREGGSWSEEGYHDASGADTSPHPVHERTAHNLADFNRELVQRWVDGEPRIAEAVDDALWSVAVFRAPAPSQRIMLGTRAVERVLGQARESARESWAPAATRYLKARWVTHALNHEMRDAAYEAFNGLESFGENEELKRRVFATFEKSRPWTEFMADFAGVAPEAVAALRVGSMQHRIVRDAVTALTSAKAALQRRRELGRRFDRLLARAERQRNALVHGTGTTEAVLEGVSDFVLVLVGYVAREVMSSAEHQREPLIELEELRVRALDQDARLEAGDSPLDTLWPLTL